MEAKAIVRLNLCHDLGAPRACGINVVWDYPPRDEPPGPRLRIAAATSRIEGRRAKIELQIWLPLGACRSLQDVPRQAW